MKDLKIINKDGQLLVDSREVAEMLGKQHAHLMRDIQGYEKVISENPKLDSQKFFVKSSYKVKGNNKTYECYLLTRKGCDMVANKMTGEKGILFTAEYVTKFEEMEKELKEKQLPKTYLSALKELVASEEARIKAEEERDKLIHQGKLYNTCEIAKELGYRSARQLNKILEEKGIQYKNNGTWLLKADYSELGYTSTKQLVLDNGHITYDRKWTGIGRDFILNLFGKGGNDNE